MWSVVNSLQVGNCGTSPWEIDLSVFWLPSFKHHKSGQRLVCRWGPQFSSKLDVDSFALLQISILNLAWDILDVESAPILGPACKSCFIYVGDFCHRFGKFDSNFPANFPIFQFFQFSNFSNFSNFPIFFEIATTDRIDNLKIEPHFKVVRRSVLNKLCDCALLWNRWSRLW